MISYERLWKTMKERGVTQYDLYEHHGVGRSLLDRFRKNLNVQVLTLDKMCSILNCRIEDIVEYIPDDPVVSCEKESSADSEKKFL